MLDFHTNSKRWNVLVIHRRAGKTTAAVNHLQRAARYRVFICDNMSFNSDFKPVLAKHTANVNLHKCSLFRSDYESE